MSKNPNEFSDPVRQRVTGSNVWPQFYMKGDLVSTDEESAAGYLRWGGLFLWGILTPFLANPCWLISFEEDLGQVDGDSVLHIEFTVFNPHFSTLELESVAEGCGAESVNLSVPPMLWQNVEIRVPATSLPVGNGTRKVILKGKSGAVPFLREEEVRFVVVRKELESAQK